MVFFKNVTFSQYADRIVTNNQVEGGKIRKLTAEKRRVRNNQTTASRVFLKKLKSFETSNLQTDGLPSSSFLKHTEKGVSTSLFNFLKKNNPEHRSVRLWRRRVQILSKVDDSKKKITVQFYRDSHLRRDFFKVSDTVLSSELSLSGETGLRGYFQNLTNSNYANPGKVKSGLSPELYLPFAGVSHRIFTMGDRYGAIRFYWFFKTMELARSSIFVEKRYIRRGVFYFVKLVPWWRQYSLVLRRLKSALKAKDEFNHIDGLGLEDKLKVEFLAALSGDEGKSQLLLAKAETVSMLCEGRLKVHFR